MTRTQIAETNTAHFPNDPVWQHHCAKMASRTDPTTGLPLDLIRDICSGEYTGPLPELKP